MPILTNPKHELFAQALAKGENATKAYQSAGFKGSRANASRLKANSNVAARVLELSVAGAKSAEVSVASLLAELEDARAKATSLNQLSAAVRATSEKAKISGLMTQKIEVEVNQAEYEPQCCEEVLANVAQMVGIEAAKALAVAFKLEFDEPAIRAWYDGPNGSQRQQAIEWRPPRSDRKRELG